tara:strand:+ start:14369 stop:16171 length:1803 start_codon:yes stop_codon:yes gene_type:complete
MVAEVKTSIHSNRIADLDAKIVSLNEKRNNFTVARLTTLIVGFIGCFLTWDLSIYYVIGVINLVIIAFVTVSYSETKINNKITFLKKRKEVFELENQLHNRNFDGLDEGKEFIIPLHNFSHDLDIFGYKSIFQLLNRTSTHKGKQILGKWLNNPLIKPDKIKNKQEAIKELASKDEWCYKFLAFGRSSNDKSETQETINKWLNEKDLCSTPFLRVIGILLPLITIALGVGFLLGLFGKSYFIYAFLIQLGISGKFAGKITKVQSRLGSRFAIIENYIKIVRSIENEDFQSNYLLTLKRIFVDKEKNFSVTQTLNRLKKLLDKLDARLNIYLAILLNGLLLWDINTTAQIENWKRKNKENLIKWMNAVGEIDALISLALFAANHRNYVYPQVTLEKRVLHLENAGHPLIEEEKLIKNDYYQDGEAKVDLLTGANMAGKSTFLRTVGVNLILARIGAPVCANKFIFSPLKLFSSLRTVDSLKDNESFFYAELKRLKQLIELYLSGEEIFFLLDEILKGTNSADQHKGSIGLIKKLIKLKGNGIIATHDIKLSDLVNDYPKNIRNLCFEIEILENQLDFDYKLKPGFCTTMNASFLMENMGII